MATHTISNTQDIIDSRDVIARLEELRDERTGLLEQTIEHGDLPETHEALTEWDEENGEELKALEALNTEGGGVSEWTDGATLIRESHWVEYVEELVKDIGDIPREIPSYIEIDWDKTADNLKVDYSTVDFDGETYYVRN